MDYLTPAEFLARGFGLPPLETPPTPLLQEDGRWLYMGGAGAHEEVD